LEVAARRASAAAFVDPARPSSVLFVVDVTPYVRENRPQFVESFAALKKEFGDRGAWRLARLGAAPGPSRADPEALVADLDHAFDADDLVRVDTLAALRSSLKGLSGPGVVVYFADWNVEDESDPEGFIAELKKRGLRLHVVGAEAGFQRPWQDGFFPPDRGTRGPDGVMKLYDAGVGRSPFGPAVPGAPLRAGDAAWAAYPFYWNGAYWVTTFPVSLRTLPPKKKDDYGRAARRAGASGKAEDLRERSGDVETDALEHYSFPLPSSFGPWALSRAVRETGGRYALWSWNRTGRTNLVYDDVRCDLYAPDLRDRETIRKDAMKRALPRAILGAWRELANPKVCVSRTTPPLAPTGVPQDGVEAPSEGYFTYGWDDPSRFREMLRQAREAKAAADRAVALLDAALKNLPANPDVVDRRYAADADLLRHTVLVHRFTIGEALLAEKEVPADAWSDRTLQPGFYPETAIRGGEEPESAVIEPGAPIRDRALCERIAADRRRFLAQYAGTPYGVLVGKNRVMTLKFFKNRYGSGTPARQSPADSDVRRGRTGPGSAPGQGGTTGGR
jgi:hypothetical protein